MVDVIYYGRESCCYCNSFKSILEKNYRDKIKSFEVCYDYRKTVPRLSVFDSKGLLIHNEYGFIEKNKLELFFKKYGL